jgi:hypothetical protein
VDVDVDVDVDVRIAVIAASTYKAAPVGRLNISRKEELMVREFNSHYSNAPFLISQATQSPARRIH